MTKFMNAPLKLPKTFRHPADIANWFAKNLPELTGWAKRMAENLRLNSWEDHEGVDRSWTDILQETFVRILSNKCKCPDTVALYPFTYMTMRTVSIDLKRAQESSLARSVAGDILDKLVDTELPIDEYVCSAEVLEIIHDELSVAPSVPWEYFFAKYMENLRGARLSAALGVTPVKLEKYRARLARKRPAIQRRLSNFHHI